MLRASSDSEDDEEQPPVSRGPRPRLPGRRRGGRNAYSTVALSPSSPTDEAVVEGAGPNEEPDGIVHSLPQGDFVSLNDGNRRSRPHLLSQFLRSTLHRGTVTTTQHDLVASSFSDDDSTGKETSGSSTDSLITVVILDFTQKKFRIPEVNPRTWTVRQLKETGASIHHVPSEQQRLIFRGQLLGDEDKILATYRGFQGAGDQDSELIVHLFPKPRVVITSSNDGNNNGTAANDETANSAESSNESHAAGSAHVPTIVLNSDEVERRGTILVLGSSEYVEAVNNVKMFSLMLLIISTLELLNLLGIATGSASNNSNTLVQNTNEVPDDTFGPVTGSNSVPSMDFNNEAFPTSNLDDDIFPDDNPDTENTTSSVIKSILTSAITNSSNIIYHNHTKDSSSHGAAAGAGSATGWTMSNTVDLLVSIIGVYAGLLGIKASNENTLRQARKYLRATVAAGVSWFAYNFYVTYLFDEKMDIEQREMYDDDKVFPSASTTPSELINQVLSVMVLPALLWILCCARAYQFQNLLQEAEEEAATRMLPTTTASAAASVTDAGSARDIEQQASSGGRDGILSAQVPLQNTRSIMLADDDIPGDSTAASQRRDIT
jgi:Ubiquitin family